jgi:hypothetical protein
MAIEIRPTDSGNSFSIGDFTNPLCFTFNGSMGGQQEKKLYLRNTDSVNSVSVEIKASLGDTSSPPYKVYLKKSGDNQQWVEASIDVGSVDADGTAFFFLKIEVDPDTPVQNFTDLKIEVTES